jgi:alcohol dehydrogenase (cytochrome c)
MPNTFCHTFLVVCLAGIAGAQIPAADPVNATPDAADWPMYAHDYTSSRFSPLTEITPNNVAGVRQICSFPVPEKTTFESSLVEIGGMLYFTTGSTTYAIDAANCRLKWQEKHDGGGPGGFGTVRGVAVAGKRVFRGFRDGYVIAYDTSNGEQVWSTKLTAPDGRNATVASSPVAWDGMVIIGTSGGENNCSCFMAALDAETGKIKWTFNTVPAAGDADAATWPKGVTPGGGSMWSSFTIDPETSSLYLSTGNPGFDFAGDFRPGKNLYTDSVVVLDAKTGKLRNYYQIVEHDYHDWDLTAPPVVLRTKSGQSRAMVAGKDGFLTSIDPKAQKIIWKTPITTIENIEAPLTAEGTHFCPGTAGGSQWNGPAFSPATNLVYVNAVDWCSTVKSDPEYDGKKNMLGSANAFGDKAKDVAGWVTAVDADSGAVRWKFKTSTPMVAGIAVTASGLVLTADLGSDFLAFDAASGKLLRRISLGQPTGGGVVTYRAGGKQKIAVATGLEDRIMETHGTPSVVVFGL